MSDCVDREAVLDLVFVEYCKNCALTVADEACTIKCEDHRAFMEKIAKLPAVEPERPTGHWIIHSEHCKSLGVQPSGLGEYYWCSQCNCGIDSKAFHMIEYNFCPHCGVKMENNA